MPDLPRHVAGLKPWLDLAAEFVWGAVPERFATIVLHPANASATEKQSLLTAHRAPAVLRPAMDSRRRSGVITEQTFPRAIWEDLMTGLTSYFDAKAAFDRDRRGPFPWVLNPAAWRNRIQLERSFRQLHRLKMAALSASLKRKS